LQADAVPAITLTDVWALDIMLFELMALRCSDIKSFSLSDSVPNIVADLSAIFRKAFQEMPAERNAATTVPWKNKVLACP